MFITNYGSFDGNSWEVMFQIILKRKYMDVGYVKVKASPGDFGIEGYTKDGKTFQCYCPDFNLDSKSIYEKQRKKITDDINKLKVNQKELLDILGGVKLKNWILITPTIAHRDLINHCNKKRDLVKSWGLGFINSDLFQVLVHEADDYAMEIGEYFSYTGKKFSLVPNKEELSVERVVAWQNTEIDLVKNANNKNEIRINSLPNKNDIDRKINALTDETVRFYLNGESILRTWQGSQPENHQRFIELLASVEDELRVKCLLNIVEPNWFVKEVSDYIDERIRSAFSFLDESTIVRLKNYSVSFWLLRCPLYFEKTNNEN
ncbi:MAG: hypothetical protein KGM16_11145 [Bacteroidota bacterium]|nr:hypothetical protein [Bacteroidota bacterium]